MFKEGIMAPRIIIRGNGITYEMKLNTTFLVQLRRRQWRGEVHYQLEGVRWTPRKNVNP